MEETQQADQPEEQYDGPVLVDFDGEFGALTFNQPLRPCVVCAAACTVTISGWVSHPTCFQYSTATTRGPLADTEATSTVVVDERSVYLPGTAFRWPHEATHLGHLAAIATPLNVAAPNPGGRGQIWLTAAALSRLGGDATTEGADLATHPVITGAAADGWSTETGTRPGWVTLIHPDKAPAGVDLVLIPYASSTAGPVVDDDPTPAQLVTRLDGFARRTGEIYRGPEATLAALLQKTAPAPATVQNAPVQRDTPPKPAATTPAATTRAPASQQRTPKRDVEADEIRAAITWSQEHPGLPTFTPDRAIAAVERWHEVTECKWSGTHGVIQALLSGHTKWPGAKTPKPADLRLFDELRTAESIWVARSWIINPDPPQATSLVIGADVNAQYAAAAGSVELGEGDPATLSGDDLTEKTLKLPGWVRLAETVDDAPYGLRLDVDMWIPTPLAHYLEHDKQIDLAVSEALVWTDKRRALNALTGLFRDWLKTLRPDPSEPGRDALAMLKSVYTKALGGYLSSDKGLTEPQWRRPDWALLIKAQAEANALRAMDKLPEGCAPMAKYADAFYIEQVDGADLLQWPNLDEHQPGKFALMEPGAVPAAAFAECATAEDWRTIYLTAGQ